MDRRTYVKGMLVAAVTFLSSISIWTWFKTTATPDITLLKQKRPLIAELAEAIIPRTDTPGAKDVKVEDFIIEMITYGTERRVQNSFFAGLEKLENHSLDAYNRQFTACTTNQKLAIIDYFERKAIYSYPIINRIHNKLFGLPFILKFKELTVEGYCTSQKGAMLGLRYEANPGRFEACTPLLSGQKSWATK